MNRATPKALEWQRRKRSALAPVGKKGRVKKAEWAEAKRLHLIKEPECQFNAVWTAEAKYLGGEMWVECHKGAQTRCKRPLDVHHVIPRGMGGGKDYGVYATLCRAHHQWVEDHREAGRTLGLLARPPSTDAA